MHAKLSDRELENPAETSERRSSFCFIPTAVSFGIGRYAPRRASGYRADANRSKSRSPKAPDTTASDAAPEARVARDSRGRRVPFQRKGIREGGVTNPSCRRDSADPAAVAVARGSGTDRQGYASRDLSAADARHRRRTCGGLVGIEGALRQFNNADEIAAPADLPDRGRDEIAAAAAGTGNLPANRIHRAERGA
jgi:hypothetical protein